MSSEGDTTAQASTVAEVASDVFGQRVEPANVIAETLIRATREFHDADANEGASLLERVVHPDQIPAEYDSLRSDPLAAWIEATFGLRTEASTGKLIRQTPKPIRGAAGAASELAGLVGCSTPQAQAAIERALLLGSNARQPAAPYPLFAFRLHQFITRGDTVWATLEPETERYLTLRAQQFKPGDRERLLYPLVFCRQCGQAYYRVHKASKAVPQTILPREGFDRSDEEDAIPGYLYLSTESPWPTDRLEVMDRVPETWLEKRPDGSKRLRPGQSAPQVIQITPDGKIGDRGVTAAFVPAPFRFCLNPQCRVAYTNRQRAERSL